ncbi:MAG: SU10 major capsid protein [Candidatus Helarchaeota archaeon]
MQVDPIEVLKDLNMDSSVDWGALEDEQLRDYARYINEVRAVVPRKRGSGRGYDVRYHVSQTDPYTTQSLLAEFADDDTSLDEETGTVYLKSFNYVNFGMKGKVYQADIDKGKEKTDLLQDEIQFIINRIVERETWLMFWGRADATTAITEMSGLYYYCANATTEFNIGDDRVIQMGSDANAATLTLTKLDELISSVKGKKKAIFCSEGGLRELKGLVYGYLSLNTTEVDPGIKVPSYEGVPIFVTSAIPDTITLDPNGLISSAAASGLTRYQLWGGDSTAFFCVNLDNVFFVDLVPLKKESLGKTSAQVEEFEVYERSVLVVNDPYGIAALVGVKRTL